MNNRIEARATGEASARGGNPNRTGGFLILLALFATQAMAASVDLSCIAPTLNEDGTAYLDQGGFTFFWGPTQGGPYPTSVDETDPTNCAQTISDLTEGTWYFVVTAWDDKTPRNESVKSNEATKNVGIPPQPPSMMTVQNLTVYTVSKQIDKFVLFAVGTVPVGTSCDSTQSVNGFYVVPIAEVTWTGTVDPDVVVADCA